MAENNSLGLLAQQITENNTNTLGSDDTSGVKEQILENKNTTNTFQDVATFNKHVDAMRNLIEAEFKQKRTFRSWATGISLFLVVYSIVAITALFWYLIVKRNHIPDKTVLIGLSVSLIANVIGLTTVVFKYVFSSTKDTTDYISKIISRD